MKTMARQIGTVLCMALALLSAFYAFAVMKTHSGTGFWKVWLVIAAVFALLAVGIAANWWVALPRIIRGVIIAVVCIGIAIFGTVEGCIISNMHARGDQHLDYVVVLGAQVRKSGPSKALRYRLDTAADYLRNSPDTICIVSGGKGANEPFPEAQGMADYLKAHGIEEGRILQESKSKTTQENIVNSKKLIAGDNASVGIITNDFHMFRALQIAHDNGLDEAQGIAAGSPPDMLVNNMVRESSPKSNSCCPSSCKFRAWILEIASPAGSMSEGQLALRRGVRTTRQPLPFRQCGECGPLFRGIRGRFETTLEAGPIRIGFQQPSEQQRCGMRVAQRAVRILIGDAEVVAAVGKLAATNQ